MKVNLFSSSTEYVTLSMSFIWITGAYYFLFLCLPMYMAMEIYHPVMYTQIATALLNTLRECSPSIVAEGLEPVAAGLEKERGEYRHTLIESTRTYSFLLFLNSAFSF